MFRFFKSKEEAKCPVSEEQRKWLENAVLWLFHQFGFENLQAKPVLLPNERDFPIVYDQSHESARKTLDIIAKQMDIDPKDVELEYYSEGPQELSSGTPIGPSFYLKREEDDRFSSGKYWGKHENDKYFIGLNENNLSDPIGLVGTLSHELSHIKLLGEKRIEKNNEPLTDLTTVVFGLGVFNANAAFRFHSSYKSWGYLKIGYLSQMDWAYALALYSYLRQETKPEWANHLTANIKADVKRSELFIRENESIIFKR